MVKFGNCTSEVGRHQPSLTKLVLVGLLYFVTYAVPNFQSVEDVAIADAACLIHKKTTCSNALHDGDCEVLQLFGELQSRGYPGSYDTVARYAR